MRRLLAFLRYAFVFARALVAANVDVVRKVLSPSLEIRPGFLAVPIDSISDFEITSLANSITLTPGTIAVHLAEDRSAIVIHVLDIGDDADAIRRDVRETLERNILDWARPHGVPQR